MNYNDLTRPNSPKWRFMRGNSPQTTSFQAGEVFFLHPDGVAFPNLPKPQGLSSSWTGATAAARAQPPQTQPGDLAGSELGRADGKRHVESLRERTVELGVLTINRQVFGVSEIYASC